MKLPSLTFFTDRYLLKLLLASLLVYSVTAKGGLEVIDTTFSLQTAQAIVERGELDIPAYEGFTLAGKNSKSYSKYGIGLALYYVPYVVLGRSVGRATGLLEPELIQFLVSFGNIPFALLSIILFSNLLSVFGIQKHWALILSFSLAFGTITWRYAGSDYNEVMQMSLLLLTVLNVVEGGSKVFLAGVGFAGLLLLKIVHGAMLPLFVIYILLRPGLFREKLRRLGAFAIPVSVALIGLACLNAVRFGSPLESGYGSEASLFFPAQLWHTIPRLILSLDKGIFIFCPILLLGVVGWRHFARHFRYEAALIGSLIILNLIVSGAWHSWIGGWAWGPRLLVPTLPLWLLPAGFFLESIKSRAVFWSTALLVIVSVIAQVPGVLVKDQEINEIKLHRLTEEERLIAASDFVMAWELVRHKVTIGDATYKVSEFGIPGTRQLDLGQNPLFIGLNLWSEHSARHLHKPFIRWIPVMPLVLAAVLMIKVGAELRRDIASALATPR